MDLCCEYPFPGFTINDETDGVDSPVLVENGIVGLDGGPIRRQVDPRGVANGGLVHTAWFGPRLVAWRGKILIQSVDWALNAEYLAAVNTLMLTMTSGLEGIMNADYTLNWAPTGLGAHSLVLRYGMPGGEVQFSGTMLDLQWTFQTISADPAIEIS